MIMMPYGRCRSSLQLTGTQTSGTPQAATCRWSPRCLDEERRTRAATRRADRYQPRVRPPTPHVAWTWGEVTLQPAAWADRPAPLPPARRLTAATSAICLLPAPSARPSFQRMSARSLATTSSWPLAAAPVTPALASD